MNNYEVDYKNLLQDILDFGVQRFSRTGDTLGLFNRELSINLKDGFPMITGRKLYWKNIKYEAEWMLKGDTNIKFLNEYNVHIWDEFANENGELGPTYGAQLHKQWDKIIREIKINPYSRRLLIDLWNIEDLEKMSLPPCYYSLQFYYSLGVLNLKVCSRSSDAAIGLPYDIAVCAYFLHVACAQTKLIPGQLIFSMCDVHINEENISFIEKYLNSKIFPLPILDNFILFNYQSSLPIPMVLKK